MGNFEKLWDNHPSVESLFNDFPCMNNIKKAFDNQCAIRVGVSLEKAGYDTSTFKGARCWYKHSPSHILRAEELANWETTLDSRAVVLSNEKVISPGQCVAVNC